MCANEDDIPHNPSCNELPCHSGLVPGRSNSCGPRPNIAYLGYGIKSRESVPFENGASFAEKFFGSISVYLWYHLSKCPSQLLGFRLGETCVFEVEAAWCHSAANAVNLAHENHIPVAWLPLLGSLIMMIRTSMPFP